MHEADMDYKKAASYWEEKDLLSKHMERADLLAEADKFLSARNTCALACGAGDFVRCTPIEYTWRENALWMFSEGGLKFRALEKNKTVCVAVFDSYCGFGALNGLQLTGTAKLVEPWSAEYLAMLEYKKIPAESLKKLPNVMKLIKVTPKCADLLCSDFKKRGFDSRQHVDF